MAPKEPPYLLHIIEHLCHALPSQAPLKDFVHHNTLHAFQDLHFHLALKQGANIYGYHVYLPLAVYREKYHSGKINQQVLRSVVSKKNTGDQAEVWFDKLLASDSIYAVEPAIGRLRHLWVDAVHFNMDKAVHGILFRLLQSYLDQGISIWKFPVHGKGFLAAVRSLHTQSYTSLFKSKRALEWLLDPKTTVAKLLEVLVGEQRYHEAYLTDQQFAHPGWSGMVSVLERQPEALFDRRHITFRELLLLECLLEIDALDRKFGDKWKPLGSYAPPSLFAVPNQAENDLHFGLLAMWQEALEWTQYDQVIAGLQQAPLPLAAEKGATSAKITPDFHALFCIDDRNCSVRRYVEQVVPGCKTYGTAGFFNLPLYFVPEHGKFMTKVCPAPMKAAHVVKESQARKRHEKVAGFSKHSHGVVGAWFMSQTLGFLAAVRLVKNIFRPGPTPFMVSSFDHMDAHGRISVEHTHHINTHHGMQVGFTPDEMAGALESLLKSIGLTEGFGPLVYVIGHGASSVNNTHYSGYDCGACSGKAGSVNARAMAHIGNHPEVRTRLSAKGIHLPEGTQFVGGLHDTTRDEMVFYDEDVLSHANRALHEENKNNFSKAMMLNAKERSRRFHNIRSGDPIARIHDKVKLRAMSLFEPRPEWNHATNALCIVGRRETNRHLFLDKRAFLQSYDYRMDADGNHLLGILRAVAPVCGGINLEYYFSTVDNERLGAGSKLPHNVMGLIGVANGIDGDLRTGLPGQMVNIHDPLRLLITVEQRPQVVLRTIQSDAKLYGWFENEWVRLVVIDPESRKAFHFGQGAFTPYTPHTGELPRVNDLNTLLESTSENLPVYLLA